MFKNMFNKIFKRRDRNAENIESLARVQAVVNSYLIALARLGFIKPGDLARESQNKKANDEYVMEMIKIEREKNVQKKK